MKFYVLFSLQDKCLISYHSEDLGIDVSDVNVGTLSRAFKFATRTRLKVNKIFLFKKIIQNI